MADGLTQEKNLAGHNQVDAKFIKRDSGNAGYRAHLIEDTLDTNQGVPVGQGLACRQPPVDADSVVKCTHWVFQVCKRTIHYLDATTMNCFRAICSMSPWAPSACGQRPGSWRTSS